MIILLVRHGQTGWNQVERFRGHADIPLNEIGLAQANTTAKRIAAQWKPTAVFSSPLSRALVTAQKISTAINLTAIPSSGLMDIDFGQWQGLTPEEAQTQWPEQIDNWAHAPQELAIPGGETFDQVQSRALKINLRPV